LFRPLRTAPKWCIFVSPIASNVPADIVLVHMACHIMLLSLR